MVKNIADKIGCSVQPIYSYCKNMEGLRRDVVEQVGVFIQNYVRTHIDKEDLVVYTFARKQLPAEFLEKVNNDTIDFEEKASKDGIQEHYISLLESLENKYLN